MEAETVEFLNTLGEAERAGGRVLHALEQEANSLELKELLRKTAHDEGYYAGQIGAHIRRLGAEPSTRTGDFVEKVAALKDLKSKIELLEPRPALGNPQDRGAAAHLERRSSQGVFGGDGQGPSGQYPGSRRCSDGRPALIRRRAMRRPARLDQVLLSALPLLAMSCGRFAASPRRCSRPHFRPAYSRP